MVNGYSPLWWVAPRILRISTVRRRFSCLEPVAQQDHVVGDELLHAPAADAAVFLGALDGERGW
jgi:hypothetical protein